MPHNTRTSCNVTKCPSAISAYVCAWRESVYTKDLGTLIAPADDACRKSVSFLSSYQFFNMCDSFTTLQTKLGKKTTMHTINPKAITVSELYGVLDPDTRDWTDGLLSNIFREINKPLPPDKDEARWALR